MSPASLYWSIWSQNFRLKCLKRSTSKEDITERCRLIYPTIKLNLKACISAVNRSCLCKVFQQEKLSRIRQQLLHSFASRLREPRDYANLNVLRLDILIFLIILSCYQLNRQYMSRWVYVFIYFFDEPMSNYYSNMNFFLLSLSS